MIPQAACITKELIMAAHTQTILETIHHRTGRLVVLGNRLLAAIVLLGALFCVISVTALGILKNPEQFLHTQAFMMNYTEFSRAQAVLTPTHTERNPQDSDNTDPDWDGMLAGAGIGATLGQNIPLLGSIGGPIIGAVIGYQLDSRI
jgi:hypothetical protein